LPNPVSVKEVLLLINERVIRTGGEFRIIRKIIIRKILRLRQIWKKKR
jgi:hypothetical protein